MYTEQFSHYGLSFVLLPLRVLIMSEAALLTALASTFVGVRAVPPSPPIVEPFSVEDFLAVPFRPPLPPALTMSEAQKSGSNFTLFWRVMV